jgi:integrase
MVAVEKPIQPIEPADNPSSISYTDGNITGGIFGDVTAKPRKKRASYGSSLTNAIRDREDIEKAKQWLLEQPQRYSDQPLNIRNYCLFVFCCNCARRISDILSFNVSDVVHQNGSIKKKIYLLEQKTGKYESVYTNPATYEALKRYLEARAGCELTDPKFQELMDEPLFLGREGRITRHRAWEITSRMGDAIGLKEKGINFAPHGCRKTWAYQSLKNNANNPVALATVSEALNHSSEKVTRKYADITEEEIENLYNSTVL